MKTLSNKRTACLLLTAFSLSLFSCDELFEQVNPDYGSLHVMFAEDFEPQTKSSKYPDVNDFILTVVNQNGGTVYEGKFGGAPESFAVEPGSYTVSAVSCAFNEPKFDAPQYGDSQVAVVTSGQNTDVQLLCSQQNAGVKLNIASDFIELYPNGVLFLNSSGGKLMYSYSEKRFAYFKAGSVSLVLNENDSDKVLMTRALSAGQMLTVNINASKSSSADSKTNVKVSVDTTRQWLSEDYDLGGNAGGSSPATAYSVSQARNHTGAKGVWVTGYMTGGDLTSSKCSFSPPFKSRTNLVLSSKQNCTDRDLCLSVQLAKGDVRDALNLVDNENLLGRKVYIKGNIVESYYGLPGIQDITEYSLE